MVETHSSATESAPILWVAVVPWRPFFSYVVKLSATSATNAVMLAATVSTSDGLNARASPSDKIGFTQRGEASCICFSHFASTTQPL